MTLKERNADGPLDLAILGSATPPIRVEWSEREVMLYALGVGAGAEDPARELRYTTENSAGARLVALPSFLTILAVGHRPPAMAALDPGRFLHAEQEIELAEPLPTFGSGFVVTSVEDVLDKGSGAILTTRATLSRDEAGLEPVGAARSSIFVRGGGGFGGPRGARSDSTLPERAPDCRIVHRTRPDQPLLYRLSGDRHPLHSDPAFARERGFARPILHGLCTYGFAARALIEALCPEDPERLLHMRGRFTSPALPGTALVTEVWRGEAGAFRFRTLDDAGKAVLDGGSGTIGAS